METLKREKQIKKRLKKNQKLSLMGFVVVTASAIVAFYTFPSLSTAGWIAIIFAFVTAMCWFLPLAMAAAEMATVRGWTHGGIFTWVRNILGPRWGFMVNWLQFQVTLGFVAMIFFVLTSFGFTFGGTDGYNFINSLKLGSTFSQSTNINYSNDYDRNWVFLIGIVLLVFIMALSLLGQHKVHILGELGFTIGILTPFLIVSGFSIYTVATMKEPLSIIGSTFQKSHHFDFFNMGDSFILNKQFMTSTVMASFMAFMFSLHGVEVSAVAANRMSNPSKMYPKAMSIVVALALICSVLGSITISMTVPSSTLSFTGGLIQSMLFTMSVTGVDVNGVHYKTLADAYSQIETQHGTIVADAMMNQFIYGDKSSFAQGAAVIDPITGNPITSITTSQAKSSFMKGIQTLSFFVGFGVFAEIAVWTSNLSNGLGYALEKQHFHKVITYRTKKTKSPITLIVFNIFMICIMFTIFTYSYKNLDTYVGKTFTDVMATGNNISWQIDPLKQQEIRNIITPLYHSNDLVNGMQVHQSIMNHDVTNVQIKDALSKIKDTLGFTPVASGTPASETNISFISNVIMQISTYFVGYTIFLVGYIKFATSKKQVIRQFNLKYRWLQITFALLAMSTTLFAAVATYLPAAPELYPGKEVYFNFLMVSLPTYIIVLLIGLVAYQINKSKNKKKGFDVSEKPNLVNGTIEQWDLKVNKHMYELNNQIDFSNLEQVTREINVLWDEYIKTDNKNVYRQLQKMINISSKETKKIELKVGSIIKYKEMLKISNEIDELYSKADVISEKIGSNSDEYNNLLEKMEELEHKLQDLQYSYWQNI